MNKQRTDFENIPQDAQIVLHPADANFIHREPVRATYMNGMFYCEGSDPLRRGADYHLGEVSAFCRAWELAA